MVAVSEVDDEDSFVEDSEPDPVTSAATSSAKPHQKTNLPSNIFGANFKPDDDDDEDAPPLEGAESSNHIGEIGLSHQAAAARNLEETKLSSQLETEGGSKFMGLLGKASEDVAKEVVVLKGNVEPATTAATPGDNMDEMD